MRIGFGRRDITPRVGVDLAGFGPFRNRHSIAVRDRLWARAMAVEQGGVIAVVVSCDLIGVPRAMAQNVRKLVTSATGVPADAVMVHCTHTHSGPSTGRSIGWGDPDAPYLEILPGRIARACIDAVEHLREAALSHAEVPCEGMSYNREYDVREKDPNVVLRDDWRPGKPELTDTTAHVVKAQADGRTIGFFSYFGCHPVVCCEETRYIHGDYAGVATNKIEQENPGATGLFLQGAQGDVNTCFVHHPEDISLHALDVIAERYARSVRAGLAAAKPLTVDSIRYALREVTFRRASWELDKLRAMLAEKESVLHAPNADDAASEVRFATVYVIALRRLVALKEAGQPFETPTDVQGIRMGPIEFLGSPLETFRAIKQEVVAQARAPLPLVMGITNDTLGYAPDRETAAKATGYAAGFVPLMGGTVPFADVHDELVRTLLSLDAALQSPSTSGRP
jgi:hypothetical protein